MRIKIYAEGFQLSSQLRALAEVRLLSALGPFREHIESAVVYLGAGSDRIDARIVRQAIDVMLVKNHL